MTTLAAKFPPTCSACGRELECGHAAALRAQASTETIRSSVFVLAGDIARCEHPEASCSLIATEVRTNLRTSRGGYELRCDLCGAVRP